MSSFSGSTGRRYRLALSAIGLALLWGTVAQGGEFRDEVARDFSVRSIGQLQITNLRGGITIKGWSQDKIRVNAKRRVVAETEEEAKRLFGALDFRYQTSGNDIELSAQYGGGLDIQQRLRERQNPKSSMEMVVLAPANFDLRVWAVDGEVKVSGWNGELEVRTAKGKIHIEDLKSESASVLCPYCAILATDIRGSLRCMGGTGDVQVERLKGKQLFIETTSGNQRTAAIEAEQLYVSKAGTITARDLRGRVEFHSTEGAIDIQDASGFASGNTVNGNIFVRMKEWRFADKALIESVRGHVHLEVPSVFSGEVDVRSLSGKSEVSFPMESLEDPRLIGPLPANQLRGRIGSSTEQLKLFSREGNVRLTQSR